MGIDIRIVPKNWEHPLGDDGKFVPLFDDKFDNEYAEWNQMREEWLKGIAPFKGKENPKTIRELIEAIGVCPDPSIYADYQGQARTHFVIYESYTEGTPITPKFATIRGLEDHLVNVGDKIRGKYTREDAHHLCTLPWIPTAEPVKEEQLEKANNLLKAMKAVDQNKKSRRKSL